MVKAARRRLRDTEPQEEGFEELLAAGLRSTAPAARVAAHSSKTSAREPQHEAAPAPRLRTRRKRSMQTEDMFYIPVDEIPDGLSYEWKRWTNVGQEDPFYVAGLREQGWEPVPSERHPTWVPPNYKEPYIIKNGQILMDRPMELTKEAHAEERMLAKRQMRDAEARLGLAPREGGSATMERIAPKITKEVGRMVPMSIEE